MLIIAVTGTLLQIKKQVPWVQPVEQKGTKAPPVVPMDAYLQVARDQGVAQEWSDIDRLDIRPGKGIAKLITKNQWELQIDVTTGKVLQKEVRRSDFIESIHDGSFFGGDVVKLGLFLPAAIVLTGLGITGIWLFILPIRARRRKAKPTGATGT